MPKCARRITKEPSNVKALAAIQEFIRPEAWEEYLRRGGINADYCDYLQKVYQGWRKAPGREAQSKGGKGKAQYLKRGKNKPDNTPDG